MFPAWYKSGMMFILAFTIGYLLSWFIRSYWLS